MSELEHETKIIVREALIADKNFIYSTWLKGQYYGCEYYAKIPHEVFYAHYPKQLDTILSLPDTRINVAVLESDPDVIISYVVYSSSGALYWVFTKLAWRGKGYARKALPGAVTCVKSDTKSGSAIAAKKGWKFNPWL